MFGYYLELALRSLRRSRALTALMILAIALGIGASMTTLTVLHVLSGGSAAGTQRIDLHAASRSTRAEGFDLSADLPAQVTWTDGMNLLNARPRAPAGADDGRRSCRSSRTTRRSILSFVSARYTSADFFGMFDTPFRYGQAWSATEDEQRAHIAVIGAELNDRLFHGENSVGRTIRANGADMRIVGVLKPWRPVPALL